MLACDSGEPGDPVEGVEVHWGSDGVELLDRVETVIKSPGVPRSAPVIRAALDHGIEVVGEFEIAWRLLDDEFVAVTGTNGKTTTTELLGAIFRAAGRRVAVAGNVGTALSSLVGGVHDLVVAECSSFQLEDSSRFAPECALLLNLEEDHLDRHGTLEAYRAAKLRIFANQRSGDVAVVPSGFAARRSAQGWLRSGDVALARGPSTTRRSAQGQPLPGDAEVVWFGGREGDVALGEGLLRWRGERLMAAADVRLRGAHNLQNAMGAAAAALSRGVEPGAVREALGTFAGVEHRLEEVVERGGVLYVNDSKATNVASTRAALEAFDRGVHAILGGSLKGGDFRGLRDAVADHCRACYLIGEAAGQFAIDLVETGIALHRCGDLERAVHAARDAAVHGEVVLLSPACASYDQYSDYEARGRHFRALVEE
ncbi:MAG: UDP-N-acetylmuramoyl-L-alanine--D-glutamate ligase [Thermoleophilaceae bacterium]